MNRHAFLFAPWVVLAMAAPAQESRPSAATSRPAQTDEAEEAMKVPLAIGAKIAKTVSLRDVDGEAFDFASARGKPVVLHFWSITCPYEVVAEPKLQALAKHYGDKAVVLAVNANDGEIGEKPDSAAFEAEDEKDRPYAKIRAHAKEVEFNHRILIDHGGELARLLDGKTTPHCFVFDAEGVLRYQGALDDDSRGKKGEDAKQYVRSAVDALLAGEDVETTTTAPYG